MKVTKTSLGPYDVLGEYGEMQLKLEHSEINYAAYEGADSMVRLFVDTTNWEKLTEPRPSTILLKDLATRVDSCFVTVFCKVRGKIFKGDVAAGVIGQQQKPVAGFKPWTVINGGRS